MLFLRIYENAITLLQPPNACDPDARLRVWNQDWISSAVAASCPKTAWKPLLLLLQWKFDALFGFSRNKAVSGDDSHARIPAEDRVIVARRANGFGFFEPSQRLTQKIVSLKPAIWRVLTQFHLCATFGHDSGII